MTSSVSAAEPTFPESCPGSHRKCLWNPCCPGTRNHRGQRYGSGAARMVECSVTEQICQRSETTNSFYSAGFDAAAYAKGARRCAAALCADRVVRDNLRQFVHLTISGAIMKDQAGADFVVSPCHFILLRHIGMSSGKLRFSGIPSTQGRTSRITPPW